MPKDFFDVDARSLPLCGSYSPGSPESATGATCPRMDLLAKADEGREFDLTNAESAAGLYAPGPGEPDFLVSFIFFF